MTEPSLSLSYLALSANLKRPEDNFSPVSSILRNNGENDNNIIIRNHSSEVNKAFSQKSGSGRRKCVSRLIILGNNKQEKDRKILFGSLHLRPLLQSVDEIHLRNIPARHPKRGIHSTLFSDNLLNNKFFIFQCPFKLAQYRINRPSNQLMSRR